MNKPNIFKHMINWGFYGGGLLTLLIILIHTLNSLIATIPLIIFHPLIWIFAGLFGSLPGMLIGLLNALALNLFFRDKFENQIKYSMRSKLHLLVSVLSSLGGLAMMTLLWDTANWQSLLFVALLAPLLAIVALEQYLRQLELYHEQSQKQKRKPKRDLSRLLDKFHTHSDEIILIEAVEMTRHRYKGSNT